MELKEKKKKHGPPDYVAIVTGEHKREKKERKSYSM